MTRTARIANVGAVVVPFVAFLLAVVLLWNQIVHWYDLVAFAVMYLLAGFGVTIGFHRMLTHRSFQTSKPLEYTFATLGSMAVQGPVINWVADHRKHHAHTDEEGDPHSPHVGHGEGVRGVVRGIYHAHVGWLFNEHGQARRSKYAKDLMDDAGMRMIHRRFVPIVFAGLLLPGLIGFVLSGFQPWALATAVLWGGFVRVFFLHHITWSINSICHFWGSRRFDVEDHSTNVFWLALPSLGEAWHHNHHAFPRSARHGLGRIEPDPSAWVIAGMEKLGLIWGVVRISPERQQQKLAAGGRTPAAA